MIKVIGINKPLILQKLLNHAEDFMPRKLIKVAPQNAHKMVTTKKVLLFTRLGEIK